MRSTEMFLLLKIILISLHAAWTCDPQLANLTYPSAEADPKKVFTYNGTYMVADPYNALEKDGPKTKKWMCDLNNVSMKPIRNNPIWKKINATMASIWTYTQYQSISVQGQNPKFYYATVKKDLQNQAVIYQMKAPTDEPTTVLLDLNAVDPSGDTSLVNSAFSRGGSQFVYSVSKGGSEWVKIQTMSTNPIKAGTDCVEQARYSPLCWHPSGQGFFYCRYKDANTSDSTASPQNHTVWYHPLGKPQTEDVQVAGFSSFPDYRMWPEVSNCGKYFLLAVLNFAAGEPGNMYHYAELDGNPPTASFTLKPIIAKFDYEYYYIANTGTKMVFRTNNKASNWRLIVVDISNPAEDKWTNLVAEDPKAVLTWAMAVKENKIVCHYTQNMKSVMQVHAADTGQKIADIPIGIAQVVDAQGNFDSTEVLYKTQSYNCPGTLSEIDMSKPDATPQVLRETKINLPGFDPNNYKIDQVTYKSKNNTDVGMYIVKNTTANGTVPCFVSAIGAFKVGVLPEYSSANIIWLNKVGMLAFPGIRGGNENGDNWWDQGRLLNKQNTYDDVEAALEYLVAQGHTEFKKIVLWGFPTPVLINQIPNKIGCAIMESPMTDLLRFPNFGMGKECMTEFGDPQSGIYFPVLRATSPIHTIIPPSEKLQYPPILAIAGQNDETTPPLHLYKWCAAMYNVTKGNPNQKEPILCLIYPNFGSNSQSTKDALNLVSDKFTFIQMTVAPNVVF